MKSIIGGINEGCIEGDVESEFAIGWMNTTALSRFNSAQMGWNSSCPRYFPS